MLFKHSGCLSRTPAGYDCGSSVAVNTLLRHVGTPAGSGLAQSVGGCWGEETAGGEGLAGFLNRLM